MLINSSLSELGFINIARVFSSQVAMSARYFETALTPLGGDAEIGDVTDDGAGAIASGIGFPDLLSW
jgi:hypothetical protein